VRQKNAAKEYYRAVYLMQRTVKDLINNISNKFQIDPQRVTQVTHVNSRGLHIVVDEDVVRELPEGQDMIVEFTPLETDQPVKHEFMAPAVSQGMVDSELPPTETLITDPLEMWLNY
jgi:chorismate mutase